MLVYVAEFILIYVTENALKSRGDIFPDFEHYTQTLHNVRLAVNISFSHRVLKSA